MKKSPATAPAPLSTEQVPASLAFFRELGAYFARHGLRASPATSAVTKDALRRLKERASGDEIRLVQRVLRAVESELGESEAKPTVRETPKPLRSKPKSKPKIRDGSVAASLAAAEGVPLPQQIERGLLIRSAELQQRLKVGRQAISIAVTAKRMFRLVGPSGERYYPAFFADEGLDRRVVEKVSQALQSLPAEAKYLFFTSVLAVLNETPLDALRRGRVEQVLAAAKAVSGQQVSPF